MTVAFFLFALAASGTADLQSVLDSYRSSQDVPGISAVVVRHNKVLFAGASGFANLKSGNPMTADSVLYIGSVSKVLTAVLALQLVDAGKLALDERVSDLGLEQADTAQPMTVAHLLSHASGLSREGDFGYWFTANFPDGAALRQHLETAPLRDVPGASLHYSNIGYALLGQLIEQVTGTSYSEALRDKVLKPLRMNASGGRGPATNPAMGYTPVDRILPSTARPFAGIGERVGRRYERSYHDALAMSPAFGGFASANDMGRFLSFLLGCNGDNVLSRAARARLYEPQASGRGLGLKVGYLGERKIARHDGWFAAHRTHLLMDMHNGIGVVVLANSDNASPGETADALLEAALSSD